MAAFGLSQIRDPALTRVEPIRLGLFVKCAGVVPDFDTFYENHFPNQSPGTISSSKKIIPI